MPDDTDEQLRNSAALLAMLPALRRMAERFQAWDHGGDDEAFWVNNGREHVEDLQVVSTRVRQYDDAAPVDHLADDIDALNARVQWCRDEIRQQVKDARQEWHLYSGGGYPLRQRAIRRRIQGLIRCARALEGKE